MQVNWTSTKLNYFTPQEILERHWKTSSILRENVSSVIYFCRNWLTFRIYIELLSLKNTKSDLDGIQILLQVVSRVPCRWLAQQYCCPGGEANCWTAKKPAKEQKAAVTGWMFEVTGTFLQLFLKWKWCPQGCEQYSRANT